MPFMQRRLRVFQEAVAWVVVVDGALRNCPPQWRWLADQTLRACGSIALNTAEGSADAGTPQERRFYRIARASAAEADACVCILLEAGLISHEFAAEAETKLNQLSAMLHGLLRSSSERQRSASPSPKRHS
jgi:four helix bundle protein